MKTNRIGLLLAVAFLYSLFSAAAFAAPDDSVLSQHIKEADGTTGQDTNTGAGVKTGHIQDGAVTTNKIVDGAVTSVKIADGAVTTTQIATGAITDEKISGPISASKISDGFFQKKYANIIVVAKSGGDFTDPVAAINAITDATASNPYLVKVMPGIYDIGSNALQMKSFVDIEGSGVNVTKITGTVFTTNGTLGLINGASDSEIRLLTVQNTATTGTIIGIRNFNAASKINHVSVNTLGGYINIGILVENTNAIIKNATVTVEGTANNQGMSIYYSSVTLTDVQVTVSGGGSNWGIDNLSSTSQMVNVTVTASSGGFATGIQIRDFSTTIIVNSSVMALNASQSVGIDVTSFEYIGQPRRNTRIDRSSIVGSTYSIRTAGYTMTSVAYSKADGVIMNGAILKCIGVYNANYDPYICP